MTKSQTLVPLSVFLGLVLVTGSSRLFAQTVPEPQDVRFEAADGLMLSGRFSPASGRGPGILLLHQCDRTNDSTGYEELASMLAEAGLHAMTLDLRGYGGSRNDRFTGTNWQEAGAHFESDVEAAFTFLTSQSGVDKERIGVVGASCGGRQALLLAQRHSTVRTIVLLSGSVRQPIMAALDAVKEVPTLVVASQDDSSAASGMKRVFESSKNAATRLILYKGKDHGTPLFSLDDTLRATIVQWLTSRLVQSRAR